ncbi:uncharacterized protein LOC115919055 [Strongylocentrotus purpuratus]|uniref:Uncharacterized protein n=1 Tax=Strongylocentrotus purpuratus TaxID=7668 RepID=A0A7M7PPG9_STRPU|nr:uncharacterized protein LOC115919055 [Strongylocentrotus purpuratus]
MAFFQGARISSRLSKQFVKSLSGTFLPATSSLRSDFYRAVCLGLARVLPHSSTPEWLTILNTLDLLRSEGLLHVSYTSHFMTSLPACDITVCQRPLQLSQVFTTVIQLLGEAGFSDRLKDDQWQHITKSYAQLMKKILSNATESISSSPSSSAHAAPQVFLIGQLFCQSCEVSRRVPGLATEQLFVWCLELVTRVEELLGWHSDNNVDVVRDVAHQEMKTLSRAIEWLPSSGQRSTLLQKVSAISSRC